ncbi:hypothetical protein FIU82_05220 [Pseudoalteromonas sp. THAF3]|nr:hypothetical protein FIU82_05220 [Pseudoalteromonas sp. THAF3]
MLKHIHDSVVEVTLLLLKATFHTRLLDFSINISYLV